ncbi:MAG: fibronectin type III domain-containing protein [Desulfobacteraceae bacterium]|nr:fibronectin type III domain-containing protein [Desulfobacteraceae bacterium]
MKKIVSIVFVIFAAIIVPSIVSAGEGCVNLSWEPAGDADLDRYQVHYGTTSRAYDTHVPVGKATTYTATGLTENVTYYFAVTAVDTSENESGYSQEVSKLIPAVTTTPVSSVSSDLQVSNLFVASGKAYEIVAGLADRSYCNIDRRYRFSNVPDFLLNAIYIKTAATDTKKLDNPFVSFDVNKNVTVYVTFDYRNVPPAWLLSDFEDTGHDLDSAVNMNIYKKDFPAGTVSLGANEKPGAMYNVIIVERKDVAPPVVSINSPVSAGVYDTLSMTVDLGGTASDNVGLQEVKWSSSGGGSGAASGLENWSISGVPLIEGDNIITVSVIDSAGNEGVQQLTVRYSPGTVSPFLSIIEPTHSGSYTTENSVVSISGSAGDNVGVSEVRWSSSSGDSGLATGLENWSISAVQLQEGENIITVIAGDEAANESSATLRIVYLPPDFTAPQITIKSPATTGTYWTDKSTVSLSGTAFDDREITTVAWAAGTNSGIAEGTESWSVRDIPLEEGTNIVAVVARDKAGNDGTSSIVVTYMPASHPPVSSVQVSNLTVASGKAYEIVEGLDNNSYCNIDRTYRFKNVPESLLNAIYIKTAATDTKKTDNSFLTFEVNKDVTVYVTYDYRNVPPAWLLEFDDAGFDIGSAVNMNVYKKNFSAGTVSLGGNEKPGAMYNVIIVDK